MSVKVHYLQTAFVAVVFCENESRTFILWLRGKNKIDMKILIRFSKTLITLHLPIFHHSFLLTTDDQKEINRMQGKTGTEQTNSICSQLKPNVFRH